MKFFIKKLAVITSVFSTYYGNTLMAYDNNYHIIQNLEAENNEYYVDHTCSNMFFSDGNVLTYDDIQEEAAELFNLYPSLIFTQLLNGNNNNLNTNVTVAELLQYLQMCNNDIASVMSNNNLDPQTRNNIKKTLGWIFEEFVSPLTYLPTLNRDEYIINIANYFDSIKFNNINRFHNETMPNLLAQINQTCQLYLNSTVADIFNQNINNNHNVLN